jgi:hypothetical protein
VAKLGGQGQGGFEIILDGQAGHRRMPQLSESLDGFRVGQFAAQASAPKCVRRLDKPEGRRRQRLVQQRIGGVPARFVQHPLQGRRDSVPVFREATLPPA